MKNVLLLDTNVSSYPIYEYLIKLGFNVYILGNNPKDYLAKVSKNYINMDYTNIKGVKDLINDLNILFIIPGCNDQSYKICVVLNENNMYYGLDSELVNETINNKEKFRIFATDHNLSIPKLYSKELNEDLKFPLIVKPVDSYSGKGISVVRSNNYNDLRKAVLNATENSSTRNYVIEEFIEGQLFSHTAFIIKNKIFIDFIVEEHCTANKFAVNTSKLVTNFSEKVLENIRFEINKIAQKLSLTDGLIHTQFIKHGESFWIIEITRRCPGDLYSQLIEMSTGFNYIEYYTRPFLNLNLTKKLNPLLNNQIIRHTISRSFTFIYNYLTFNYTIKIKRYFQFCTSGDTIKESPSGKVGIIFFEAENVNTFDETFSLLLNEKLYNV